MFERFAGQAREAVTTALNEARHCGTNQIDCEHLLIALASANTGSARMTAEAKRALELAIRAAHRGHDREITSSHLLLGILDQGHNRALTLLTSADVQPADLRADLTRRMAA